MHANLPCLRVNLPCVLLYNLCEFIIYVNLQCVSLSCVNLLCMNLPSALIYHACEFIIYVNLPCVSLFLNLLCEFTVCICHVCEFTIGELTMHVNGSFV